MTYSWYKHFQDVSLLGSREKVRCIFNVKFLAGTELLFGFPKAEEINPDCLKKAKYNYVPELKLYVNKCCVFRPVVKLPPGCA